MRILLLATFLLMFCAQAFSAPLTYVCEANESSANLLVQLVFDAKVGLLDLRTFETMPDGSYTNEVVFTDLLIYPRMPEDPTIDVEGWADVDRLNLTIDPDSLRAIARFDTFIEPTKVIQLSCEVHSR